MSVAVFKPYSKDCHTLYMVVGLGLIGARVAHFISWHTKKLTICNGNQSFDWNNADHVSGVLVSIVNEYKPERIELAWCAGKAGFSATEAEMSVEFDTFCAAMKSLKAHKTIETTVSFISSAGGIYENTPFVSSKEDISPSRPYAFSKLKQEKFLDELNLRSRIYRVSSVYGLAKKHSRTGLINSLVNYAKSRKTITIYANQNTLRDYIFNDDIARYVVANMLSEASGCLDIIASGRVTSIDALLKVVSAITKLPVNVVYDVTNDENNNDIGFNQNLIPKRLKLTSLEEGVRLINARVMLTHC